MEILKNVVEKKPGHIVVSGLFSGMIIPISYHALGLWPTVIIALGYVLGLILWLITSIKVTLRQIIIPFLVTLVFFILHKVEERECDFFPELSKLTGTPVPDPSSWPAILLYASAMFWLLIPFLIWKQQPLGYFLIWTFFTSMGISELAHFVFPLFRDQPYGYFPGMWSVILLAPAAWWGIYKLTRTYK